MLRSFIRHKLCAAEVRRNSGTLLLVETNCHHWVQMSHVVLCLGGEREEKKEGWGEGIAAAVLNIFKKTFNSSLYVFNCLLYMCYSIPLQTLIYSQISFKIY